MIHTVGFDIEDEKVVAKRALQRIAQYGGGRYYNADDAGDLTRVLRSAVHSPGYQVYDQDGKTLVATIVLNGSPVQLSPGKYGIKRAGSAEPLKPLEVTKDQTAVLSFNDVGQLELLKKSAIR